MERIIVYICIFSLVGSLSSYSVELIGKENLYIVKRGDTINKISNRYGVSSSKILQSNNINNPDILKPGQSIRLSTKKIVPKKIYNGLIINLPEYTVYHFYNGVLLDTYSIAIGKTSWRTPRGRFFIDNKALNPTWRVPPKMSKKYIKKYTTKVIPPGPDNPLGKYWIGLSIPHIGIHSTTEPGSIGYARSHGCMRMSTEEAEKLYRHLDIGTQGEIIYEPVKIAQKNGNIFIEVHEDIYNMSGDLYKTAISKLKKNKVLSFVDLERVKKAVDEKSATPVSVVKDNLIYKQALNQNYKLNKSSSKQLWNTLIID